MPAENVNIQPEIISWAISQTQDEKFDDKLMNNITQWLNGTKTSTFNQIEDLVRKPIFHWAISSCRHHQ